MLLLFSTLASLYACHGSRCPGDDTISSHIDSHENPSSAQSSQEHGIDIVFVLSPLIFLLVCFLVCACLAWCAHNSGHRKVTDMRSHVESLLIVKKLTALEDTITKKDKTLQEAEEGSTTPTGCSDVSFSLERPQSTRYSLSNGTTVLNSLSQKSIDGSPREQTLSCNICLVEYKVGDEMCWSPNKDCIHAFHKSCLLDWLMKHNKCPVCRRDYIPNDSSKA